MKKQYLLLFKEPLVLMQSLLKSFAHALGERNTKIWDIVYKKVCFSVYTRPALAYCHTTMLSP